MFRSSQKEWREGVRTEGWIDRCMSELDVV